LDDNDAFDVVIETLEDDRTMKREEMRQIASAILGYDVPTNRGRSANLAAISHRQSSNSKRWAERMNRPIGRGPRGLVSGSAASFEGAKLAAEITLIKLLEATNGKM
jgi:hypothetical protein